MRNKLLVLIVSIFTISKALVIPALAQSQSDPAAQSKPAPKRVAISGKEMSSKRIDHAHPVYPTRARENHIQGSVVVHAIISTTGEVSETKIISRPDEMLTRAALDCIENFRYRPATLNGEPVEVETTITITFRLV